MMGNYRPVGSIAHGDVGDDWGRQHFRIISGIAPNKAVQSVVPGIYSCMSCADRTDFHMPVFWRLHEGLR